VLARQKMGFGTVHTATPKNRIGSRTLIPINAGRRRIQSCTIFKYAGMRFCHLNKISEITEVRKSGVSDRPKKLGLIPRGGK